jgi:hypothetical protein
MPTKRVPKGGGAKRSTTEHQDNSSRGPTLEETAAAMVEQMDKNLLEQEAAYYLAHLPEWYDHEGEHVLIHGKEQFGFFASRDAALEEGFRRFGRVAFLVKEVRRNEESRPLVWTVL